MRIAITGASGHIGNCLVQELLKLGQQVRVLVHDFRNDLDCMDVEIIRGSILEPQSLNKLCKDVDVVIHLAARIAMDNKGADLVYDTNVNGTKNTVNAAMAAGVKKFIHFSSIDAFIPDGSLEEFDESLPIVTSNKHIYEFTKAEGERIVLKAVEEGLDACVLSPTAVIGPFDYKGSLFGKVLQKMYLQKLPMIVTGGYNMVDVRDVVKATIAAIDKGRKGEKYILSGSFATLKNLSEIIGKISGGKPSGEVPIWLARVACPFIWIYATLTNTAPLFTNHSLTIVKNSSQNISLKKVKTDLGYVPRDLEQTLWETMEWYKNNDFLNN